MGSKGIQTCWRIGLLVLALTAPAAALDVDLPSLDSARLDWNGFFRAPGWVNYRLALQTVGEPFTGRVSVICGGRYCTEINMARSSKKEVVVPVLIRAGHPPPKMVFETIEGEVFEQSEMPLPSPVMLKAGEVLTAIVAARSTTRWTDAVRFFERGRALVVEPDQLPSFAQDFEPFDLIVLPGVPSLVSDRQNAIRTWMHRGGILFLPGPEAFQDAEQRLTFHWLFSDAELGGDVEVGEVLLHWGAYNHETVFLESLGIDPQRTAPSPFGKGRIVFHPLGTGGVAFLTEPFPSLSAGEATEQSLQSFWRTLSDEIIGFADRAPPNPLHEEDSLHLVEPRKYRYFESAQWPPGLLNRTEIVIWGYAGIAALAIIVSFGVLIRKRLHFLLAVCMCMAGCFVFTVVAPKKTVVGETLDLIAMENGRLLASHDKLFHLASFAPSEVNCSFPAKDWRVHPIAISREDADAVQPKWNFGTLENGNMLVIQSIRMSEGGRYIILASKDRVDLGRLTARWEADTHLEIKNEIRHTLTHCALIRNGRALPLADFKFGDPPRRVGLAGTWPALNIHLKAIERASPAMARVTKTFAEEYAKSDEITFVAFLDRPGLKYESEDVILRRIPKPFIHLELPQPSAR